MAKKQPSRQLEQRPTHTETTAAPTNADLAPPVLEPVGNQALQREARSGAPSPATVQRVARLKGNQAVQRLLAKPVQREAEEPNLGDRIRNASGRGSTLDSGVQRKIESGLGADLSGVKVHTDGEADSLSRSVNAVAFTSGSDIFFRSGAYQPSSPGGQQLIAHEAAHVVQQSRGPVSGTPTADGVSISDPGDSFERAADAKSKQITGG